MNEITERLTTALADRYRIEREIGRGGMATVYLAEDLKHHRKVAVKVLRPDLAATMGPDRFLREIEVAAGLMHPHILPLHDSGEADGFLFYVMPYVAGESLRNRLERERELPVGDAMQIIRDVVDALASAHRQGVVHRDIKPDNVLLSEGHALVTDFGVAKAVSEATARQKLTTAGVALGTPAYMAPEQAVADPHIDHRVDIYAVGVMAYELLSGRTPFDGPTAQAVLAAHVADPPARVSTRRPAVPPAVEQFVMRCLEKKPADRWQSADEMLPQLETLTTPGGGMVPVTMQPVPRVPGRRGRRLAAAGVVALAIVAAVVGTIAILRDGEPVVVHDRVVVLPFINRTGVDSLDVVGDMAAYWLTDGLHRVPNLDVVPADLAIQAVQSLEEEGAGPGALVEGAARKLRAGTIVSGAAFVQGDSLRLHAEIVDASTLDLMASIEAVGGSADPTRALEVLRQRVMGALAQRLDVREGFIVTTEPPRYVAYREFREGLAQHYRGDYGTALEHYARAFDLDSTFLLPLVSAMISLNNLRSYERVDSVWQILKPRRAGLNLYYRTYGDLVHSLVQGDNERGLRLAREAARIAPATAAPSNAALMALNTNRPAEAVRWLEDVDPTRFPFTESMTYWNILTAARHRLGQYEREREAAARARSLLPDRPLPGMNLTARSLAAVGDIEKLNALLDTVSRQPRSGQWTSGRVLWNTAAELHAHGYQSEAQEVFERAIAAYEDLTLDTAWLRRQRAFLLFAAGRVEEARQSFNQLSAEDPGNLDFFGARGVLAALTGQRDSALAISDSLGAVTTPFLRGLNTYWRASIAAALGERDVAVHLVRQMFDEGMFHEYVRFHRDPGLESLRDFPPFIELMRPRG